MTDLQPPSGPSPAEPHGVSGMAADPSTLASTGLLVAVLFAIGAGVINCLGSPEGGVTFAQRLILLTETVDVGDVALLGIAVALLLVTPDPPGGIDRPLLLRFDAVLAAVIAVFGVIRALVLLTQDNPALFRFAGFLATIGVAIAAATVAFYAAKESFLKKEGRI